MTRRAILNVAHGQWYPRGAQRLYETLEERRENATRLFWSDQLPPGSPEHAAAPYAFKPYAFKHARQLGFDQALWLDASCWAIRPLDTIWGLLDEHGCYFEPDGHMVGEWISDDALRLLGLSRDETMEMPLIEGKCIGLDLQDAGVGAFLDEWLRLADTGGFHGGWSNDEGQVSPDPRCRGHRHDIACASPLVDSFGLPVQPVKRVGFPANGEPGDEILLLAQGL